MNRTKTTKERNHVRLRSIVAVMLAIAAIAGAWGCTSGSSTAVKTDASPQISTSPPDSPSNIAVEVSRDMPAPLRDAGEFAENIYDAAKADDWKTVNAKLAALKINAPKMSAERLGSPAFDASLATLEAAVAAKDKTNVLVNANQLTLEAADLSAKYKPMLPVEVVKLDYYGRELEIWSAAKNEQKLHETATLIRKNWDAVKGRIEVKGAKKELSAFEALVVKAEAAKTPADFARLATPILDEVDNLEKVFG